MTGTRVRPALAAAVALPVLLVVAVVVAAGVVRSRDEPLALGPAPAADAGSADCGRLLAALPDELDGGDTGGLGRRALVAPAPPGTAAWGDAPVVLRCGVDRPAELTATSRLLDVDGVQFLELPGPGASSWVAVDRPVYVVLTLPEGTGSGPLQDVAAVVRDVLAAQPVDAPPP